MQRTFLYALCSQYKLSIRINCVMLMLTVVFRCLCWPISCRQREAVNETSRVKRVKFHQNTSRSRKWSVEAHHLSYSGLNGSTSRRQQLRRSKGKIELVILMSIH